MILDVSFVESYVEQNLKSTSKSLEKAFEEAKSLGSELQNEEALTTPPINGTTTVVSPSDLSKGNDKISFLRFYVKKKMYICF